MSRGEYTSIGAERGERGERGRHHRGHGEWGERGWRGRGWWGGWGGGWPYRSFGWPYGYSSYVAPSYALPAYDIADGYVYRTGQFYVPSYGGWGYGGWPYFAGNWPYNRAMTFGPMGFPHWRSPRHFLHRHRRRVHYMLGADVD